MRMLQFIFVFLFLCVTLFAGDHRFSQNSRERHERLLEFFSEDQEAPSWWNQEYMLESDFRHKLAHAGITLDASYVTNLLGNPSGGKEQSFAYDGSFGLSINIDFTRYGLTGLNLYSALCSRTGTDLSRKIDNQFTVSQIYGSQTVRLAQLYLLETLFDKRFIMKAGRLCAGDDFLTSPLYWQYVNNAFDGNPVSIFFNIPFSAYPGATWGALVEGRPWEMLSIKAGVFNANSKIQKNKYHGCDFTFESTNGVVWITEWCLLVNEGKKDRGLPGNYKVGFYYLTGDRNKFSGGEQKGDPGLYFLFDQMIYRHDDCSYPDRGLTPFISLLLQPCNRNLFPLFMNGGLVYKGPFASRPKDVAALGFVYGRYSHDLREKQKERAVEQQLAEVVLELNYEIRINQWFYIMPDIQYIIHPKGRDTVPNAWVIGAQISLDNW